MFRPGFVVNGKDVFRPGFVVNGRDVFRPGFVVNGRDVFNLVWYPASPTLSLESGTSVQWDYTLCCLKMAACVTTPRFTTCYC